MKPLWQHPNRDAEFVHRFLIGRPGTALCVSTEGNLNQRGAKRCLAVGR